MSAVVASYGFGWLKPAVYGANEPLPAPMFTAFHVASIGNERLLAFPAVACTPSTYFTIVTVTSGAGGKGPSHGPLTRSEVVSHEVKSMVALAPTLSPEPGPTGPGPLASPHQLHSALIASVLP